MTLTSYKAARAGSVVILVDPRNTSKMCSRCGILVEKTLSDRVHSCPHCGLSVDRDWNAAINILRLGLQSVGIKTVEACPFWGAGVVTSAWPIANRISLGKFNKAPSIILYMFRRKRPNKTL